MGVQNKSVVVTGGSRGLGLGLVEVLAARGAKVTVVARGAADLEAVAERLGVATLAADIADDRAANRIMTEVRPDIVVLNAGAPPPMARLDRISWEDFSANWQTDVRGGLAWMQAALNAPLKPGSRVLAVSSGAARQGSPLSGGYAGAKTMLGFMVKYADALAKQRGLGLRFQAALPLQIVGGTGVGEAAASAYAQAAGIPREAFLARFGAPLSPRLFGEQILAILEEARYEGGLAFGLKGDAGVTILEEAATA